MQNKSGGKYINDGYFLDPGVPDAMTWNYNVCMDLVQHYNIDALHLDYIRYPQQDSGLIQLQSHGLMPSMDEPACPAPLIPCFASGGVDKSPNLYVKCMPMRLH
jgi:hypothetical protein